MDGTWEANCSGSGAGDAAGVDAKSDGQKRRRPEEINGKEIATTWLAGRRFWYTAIKGSTQVCAD